jgi:hypothetical protein
VSRAAKHTLTSIDRQQREQRFPSSFRPETILISQTELHKLLFQQLQRIPKRQSAERLRALSKRAGSAPVMATDLSAGCNDPSSFDPLTFTFFACSLLPLITSKNVTKDFR